MNIVDAIGVPAALEQCAEECDELGHACLKLARLTRGENPSPASKRETLQKISEEAADVLVCINVLAQAGILSYDSLIETAGSKTYRWEERINEMKNKEKGE